MYPRPRHRPGHAQPGPARARPNKPCDQIRIQLRASRVSQSTAQAGIHQGGHIDPRLYQDRN